MRDDISMTVVSIKPVYEIILGSDECSEFVINFKCVTPLGESDTCAMLARYFGDIYFEEGNDDAFIPKGGVFDMHGVIRVPPSEKTELIAGTEFSIPISATLLQSLKSQTYSADDNGESMDNWFGDLFDENNNLIIKDK
ncbi:hypothetical protein [Serratia marcescens]|uniref:hypothetical protein n=1 Tax=Serratia marcescens TaxID=615 RepID=UPI001E28B3A9|nr:hypothetical protein [Serratia marcescens]